MLKEKADSNEIRKFENKVVQILRNKFYDRRNINEFVAIVGELGSTPAFTTTKALFETGADISVFLPELLKNLVTSDRLVAMCKQSIFLNSLSKS